MRSKAPAVLLLRAALVVSCSGGSAKKASISPSPTPTPTPTTAPRPKVVAKDWLTGLAPRRTRSVVAVKVDNAPLARPYQTGLDQAAVVYQELAEGGLTRFLAAFESDTATSEVGPIRSARQSDMELISTFGQIPLAFSGAQPGVIAIVNATQRAGEVWNADYDNYPGAYRLGAHRKDARNFFTVPAKIASVRPGSAPKDIGLRFGLLDAGSVVTPSAVAHFSPDSRVGLTYLPATRTWRVTQNGFHMPFDPQNVIVQRVTVHGSGFVDVHKNVTPFTVTLGSGAGYVLRDGHRELVHWTRSGRGATRFVTALGTDAHLRPGRTMILLVPTTGSVVFG
jgi:hypothetical protein